MRVNNDGRSYATDPPAGQGGKLMQLSCAKARPGLSAQALLERQSEGERRPHRGLKAVLRRLAVPLLFTAISLAIAIAGGAFSASKDVVPPSPRALDVEVIVASQSPGYRVKRSYLGRIESRRDSRLSFEFAGKIQVVHVDEGQPVSKGELLAELDTEILQSNFEALTAQIENARALLDELIAGPRREDISAAEANVRRWESQLSLSQITLRRTMQLLESQAVSAQDVDEATYSEQTVAAELDLARSKLDEMLNGTRPEQIAAQQAALNQLQAERNTLAVQIRKSQLRAPFHGVISTRLLDEGEVVRAGEAVFELLDMENLEARIGIPVESLEHVSVGQQHELEFGGRRLLADIVSVKPKKSSQTRVVDVVFDLPLIQPTPAIGDIIRLQSYERNETPGYWIPTSALVETYRGLWGCYVAEDIQASPGLAKTVVRELEVLYQEADRCFVRGALMPGEQVIFSGVHRLVDDQAVQIVRQKGDPQ